MEIWLIWNAASSPRSLLAPPPSSSFTLTNFGEQTFFSTIKHGIVGPYYWQYQSHAGAIYVLLNDSKKLIFVIIIKVIKVIAI